MMCGNQFGKIEVSQKFKKVELEILQGKKKRNTEI